MQQKTQFDHDLAQLQQLLQELNNAPQLKSNKHNKQAFEHHLNTISEHLYKAI